MRRIAIASLLLVIGVLLAALPALAAVRSVESASFYFKDLSTGSTSQIVVNAGDQLAVTAIDGGGGTPHTVEIAELGISSGKMAQGSTYTTPPLTTPGTFLMVCKFHKDRGHTISLVVQGQATTTTTTTTFTTSTTSTTTTTAPTTKTSTTTTAAPVDQTKTPSTTQAGGGALGATDTTTGGSGGSDPNQKSTASTTEGSDTTIAAGSPAAAEAGLTGNDRTVWLRSVWLWLFATVPLGSLAWLVTRRSTNT